MKKILLTLFLLFTGSSFSFANDGPNVWSTSLSNAGQIWALSIAQSNQAIIYAGSNTTGVWKSTNTGSNWTQMNSGLTNLTVQALAVSATNTQIVYCGTSQTGAGAGMYKSTDGATTWTQINAGILEPTLGIQSIVVDHTNPNIAYIAVFDAVTPAVNGLYKTTNGGVNWNAAATGIGDIKNILSLAINPLNPNVLYCGTSFTITPATGPSKIYKSVNAGATWVDVSTGLPNLTTHINPVRCLSIARPDTSIVLAGLFVNSADTVGGMFVTTNGGALWTRRHTGLPNIVASLPRSCLIRPGSNREFYVGMGNTANTGLGVFRTTNAGITWTAFSGGTLANTTPIRALAFRTTSDSTLYAGGAHAALTTGQGVFSYTWIITGIGNQNGNIPKEFLLNQNYPNPFNPKTIISYDLPKAEFTTLKIYDVNGREVRTLVGEMQSAGKYHLEFDGSNLASGNYFYILKSGNSFKTKTLTIIK